MQIAFCYTYDLVKEKMLEPNSGEGKKHLNNYDTGQNN